MKMSFHCYLDKLLPFGDFNLLWNHYILQVDFTWNSELNDKDKDKFRLQTSQIRNGTDRSKQQELTRTLGNNVSLCKHFIELIKIFFLTLLFWSSSCHIFCL